VERPCARGEGVCLPGAKAKPPVSTVKPPPGEKARPTPPGDEPLMEARACLGAPRQRSGRRPRLRGEANERHAGGTHLLLARAPGACVCARACRSGGAQLVLRARQRAHKMATPESPFIGSPRPVVATLPVCPTHQVSCVLRQTKKATANEGRCANCACKQGPWRCVPRCVARSAYRTHARRVSRPSQLVLGVRQHRGRVRSF
jgi:hypothetical protein